MNARILIVEDEEPLTMLLRYNLEKPKATRSRPSRAATRPTPS